MKTKYYQVYDKEGISSRYTDYVYANNKKDAFNKAKKMYNDVGSVEYIGTTNVTKINLGSGKDIKIME